MQFALEGKGMKIPRSFSIQSHCHLRRIRAQDRCKGGKGTSLGRGKEITMELKGDKRKNLELGRHMERLMETTH